MPVSPPLITEHPGALIWWLETDRQLCRLVQDRLRECGWRVVIFHHSATMARTLKLEEPDLLLLDRRLPDADGLDVLAELRQQGHRFPVLILSGMGAPSQRIEGLAAGANDYLAKPFSLAELIWRIERLLQSAPPRPMLPRPRERAITLGPLTLEPAEALLRDASRGELHLSRGDLALLLAFLRAPGQVLSREQLARATGSLVNATTSRTLDMRLSRLRRQLRRLCADGVWIEAVRGRGYRLDLTQHDPAATDGATTGKTHVSV